MRRRRVHRARARVRRNVGAQNAQDRSLQERVLKRGPLQPRTLESRNLPRTLQLAFRNHLAPPAPPPQCKPAPRGCPILAAAVCGKGGIRLQRHVVKIRMKRHCHRSRNRPRRRRPDDRVHLAPGQRRVQRSRVRRHPVAHVNRRAGVLLVLDLRIRQRSFVVRAPVHRPQPAVNKSLLQEPVKRLQGPRLVLAATSFCTASPTARTPRCAQIAAVCRSTNFCAYSRHASKT